ncbi:hypothetical protein MIFENG_9 [Hafnia phage vB_HpaM_Meifeng]|nr:hypothetical protein MIFENG_9 [Hafnia phage vB_HpaM_Meifeng]
MALNAKSPELLTQGLKLGLWWLVLNSSMVAIGAWRRLVLHLVRSAELLSLTRVAEWLYRSCQRAE